MSRPRKYSTDEARLAARALQARERRAAKAQAPATVPAAVAVAPALVEASPPSPPLAPPPSSADLAVRQADLVERKLLADAEFEAERLRLLHEQGAREDAEREARAAAAPAETVSALERLKAGRAAVEAGDARRTAEAVAARLAWIDERADGVLAQAAAVGAQLAAWGKTWLPKLAEYDAADVDATESTRLPASKLLAAKFARLVNLIHTTHDTAVTTIKRDTAEIAAVKARVRSTGGDWGQDSHNQLLTAVRRLRTANPDILVSLDDMITGLAGVARDIADLDFAAEAEALPGGIPKYHPVDTAALDAADARHARETAAAETEARLAQSRHEAQRALNLAATVAFNQRQLADDIARQDRVDRARADAERHSALHSNTDLVRAMRG